jgi:hypothetical protein
MSNPSSKAALKALNSNPTVGKVLRDAKGESFPWSPRLFGEDDMSIFEECYKCLQKVNFDVHDASLKIPQNAIAPLTKATQRPNSFLSFLSESLLASDTKTLFSNLDNEGGISKEGKRNYVSKILVDCMANQKMLMAQVLHRYIHLLALAGRIVNEAVAKPSESEKTKAKSDKKGKQKESPILSHKASGATAVEIDD